MKVTVSKPSKTAMQSGAARTRGWFLEGEPDVPDSIDPLMGWSSSGGTARQIRMRFETLEEALHFAGEKGWACTVLPPQEKRVRPRSYADNFRYVPSGGPSERTGSQKTP
ncbi:MAG: ETC complex I subunit [Rhodospirillales bacterium]|nr:ETC complex I subunit [Rhodospirillales bacterium]